MALRRARSLAETWRLAQAAGARAGVTRVADVSGLTPFGVPVFQAVRPMARSLTVSQGKGASPLAASVSALLESVELACAEALPEPAGKISLADLPEAVRRCWSGDRGPLTIDLDPSIPRGWVEGGLAGTGEAMPMPWDLLSLDFTRPRLEYRAGSDGLASGNSREEALFAALCECLEHDMIARLERLRPGERRALQIDASSMPGASLQRELARVERAGFTPRLWSMGQHHGVPAIYCVLFAPEPPLDQITPVAGSACHPDPAAAALGALHEAVQGRASLIAGARDDILPAHYTQGSRRARGLAVKTLAVAEGPLPFAHVPAIPCTTFADGVAALLERIATLTLHPVAVFDHLPPAPGLHVVHALAPGLANLLRRRTEPRPAPAAQTPPVAVAAPRNGRIVLFAGPSIAGLALPAGIELRRPAICGDLLSLLLGSEPPAVVGLVDGCFGTAPSVWHKEILALLAAGVRVLGGASLGALRAAELAYAGMEGVGMVHHAYRSGAIERDDAVMVLQASAELAFAPLSLALVDAEAALLAARCAPAERRMMQRIVRTMPYETRSWARCLAAFRARTGGDFPLSCEELAQMPSLKRHDAARLIDRLVEAAREPVRPPVCEPPPLTSHYLRMLARTRKAAAPAPG